MGKNDGSVGGRRWFKIYFLFLMKYGYYFGINCYNDVIFTCRYFTCRDRYGLFAPAHKISRSPANKKPSSNLRRHGSRESMVSNVSNISSLTSSVTPRGARVGLEFFLSCTF